MATATHEAITADTTTSPNTSDAFTPAASDLLVVFVVGGGLFNDATVDLTSSTALTFTQITHATFNDSTDDIYAFVANALVTDTSSQTVTVAHAPHASTGTIIAVCAFAGMTRFGLSAIKQSKIVNNRLAVDTPVIIFDAACLTGNPTICMVGNGNNPAALTAPTSWTEQGDVGFATPTTGGEYVTRNSGFTGTTVTWGSASSTRWGALGLELDTAGQTTTQKALAVTATGVVVLTTATVEGPAHFFPGAPRTGLRRERRATDILLNHLVNHGLKGFPRAFDLRLPQEVSSKGKRAVDLLGRRP